MTDYTHDFSRPRDAHLFGDGPKRILSLDGGGVRGIISLAYLEKLEALLAERFVKGTDFRLCQYYDLIGGTSTGSVIATGLALGFRVSQLIDIYRTLSKQVFRGSRWHGGVLVPKFRSAPLLKVVRQFLGEETLGSERFMTGLAIVAKRMDTGSIWILHNNPRGPFFDPGDSRPDTVPNRDLPVANLIRASTAAPTYFEPELIAVAPGVQGAFVDGGISPHNNPALSLLMLATLKGYGFRWPMGESKLLLTSVGTGQHLPALSATSLKKSTGLMLALNSLSSVIDDCSELTQTLLQWMSNTPTPWTIDSEIGDLADDRLGDQTLLSYQRYDVVLSPNWLKEHLNLNFSPEELARLAQMDQPIHTEQLLELGRKAADRITPDHLPTAFDLPAG